MVVLSRRRGLGDWAWGVAPLIWNVFLRAAQYMGYKSAYIILVFKSNVGWVKLWESLGFERVATLDNATKGGLGGGNIGHLYGISLIWKRWMRTIWVLTLLVMMSLAIKRIMNMHIGTFVEIGKWRWDAKLYIAF